MGAIRAGASCRVYGAILLGLRVHEGEKAAEEINPRGSASILNRETQEERQPDQSWMPSRSCSVEDSPPSVILEIDDGTDDHAVLMSKIARFLRPGFDLRSLPTTTPPRPCSTHPSSFSPIPSPTRPLAHHHLLPLPISPSSSVNSTSESMLSLHSSRPPARLLLRLDAPRPRVQVSLDALLAVNLPGAFERYDEARQVRLDARELELMVRGTTAWVKAQAGKEGGVGGGEDAAEGARG